MARVTFQPAAGAQGEMTGPADDARLPRRRGRPPVGRADPRLGPRHQPGQRGPSPASRSARSPRTSGAWSTSVPSRRPSTVRSPGLMLTNPNTLGLFEARHREDRGGAARCRGPPLLRRGQPQRDPRQGPPGGTWAFDIVHINTHKTFTTPHGGGGPGAGPVAVTERLARFLPAPVVGYDEGQGPLVSGTPTAPTPSDACTASTATSGCWSVPIPTCAPSAVDGLVKVAERAVLNANYLRKRIEDAYPMAHPGVVHARVRRHGEALPGTGRAGPWTSPSG